MSNVRFGGRISTPCRAVAVATILLGALTACGDDGGDITLTTTKVEANPPGAMAHICWVTAKVENGSTARLKNLTVHIGLEHEGERSAGAAELTFRDIGAGATAEKTGSVGLSTINRANKETECPTTKPFIARIEKCDLGEMKQSDCEKKVALKP